MTEEDRSLGHALYVLRKQRSWSQDELADRCDGPMTPARISQYERGDKVPDLDSLERLVDALEVQLTTVFRGRALISEFLLLSARDRGVADLPYPLGSTGDQPGELAEAIRQAPEQLRGEIDSLVARVVDLASEWRDVTRRALALGAEPGAGTGGRFADLPAELPPEPPHDPGGGGDERA